MTKKKPAKSCYVLELSVGPGGSRWAETHAYTNVEHLRVWLEAFCRNRSGPSPMHGASAYHAIGYGATLAIWTIRGGEVTAYVDLHPYLRAKLPDGTVLEMGDRASVARVAEARAADEDWAWFDDVILELRWTEVAAMLERLVPPLLAIGERMTVKNPWADAPRGRRVATCLRSEIAFGSYDHESGEDLEQPFEIA